MLTSRRNPVAGPLWPSDAAIVKERDRINELRWKDPARYTRAEEVYYATGVTFQEAWDSLETK
jgi:tRNA A37 N6-isopentenylltransferase MiaA